MKTRTQTQEQINKSKEYQKKWRLKNKEYFQQYYKDNKQVMDARHKDYTNEHVDELRVYYNERMKRIANGLVAYVRIAARRGYGSLSKMNDVIGLSHVEYMNYLESKFEPWMNWNNKGLNYCKGLNITWDIDHIIPLSTATSEEELLKLLHYSNTQPLCSYVNRYVKKNKINKQ